MYHPVLRAITTDRVIDVSALDVPAVMLCYGQATQDAAGPLEAGIRAHYPDDITVLIAHVIDLHGVPSMFRGIAEGIIRGEFDKSVRELEQGQEAFDQVIILPDWDGSFVASTGLTDVGKRLGVAVFASSGLVGVVQTEEPLEEVLRLVGSVVD
jgi:hypothetical protein